MDKRIETQDEIPAADLINKFYKLGRMLADAVKKPRRYGTASLMYPSEAYTLREIAHHPGINQTELSELMYRTKGATSVAVKKLIEKQYVMREADPHDNRLSLLTTTPLGEQAYLSHLQYDIDYLETMRASLGVNREKLEDFDDVLGQMIDFFSNRKSVIGDDEIAYENSNDPHPNDHTVTMDATRILDIKKEIEA